MKNQIKVYFAQAVEGINPEDVKSNYLRVVESLKNKGYMVVNRHLLESQARNSLERKKQIVKNDLKELKNCDILLVDYSIPNRNYVGATCEIVYAYLWQKRIVVYVGESNNNKRLWLRYHATYVCKTFEEALGYIVKNFTTVK